MNPTLTDTPRYTEPSCIDKYAARPFIKWAGGKRTLIPKIRRWSPDDITTYWEPFLGGGAVFFALESRIESAELSDINEELAVAYQVVRDAPEKLIALLNERADKHSKSYYLEVREMVDIDSDIERAARFIYLNKTCYNGLYRVNKSGQFNVPMGSYQNPTICDAETLRVASEALEEAVVSVRDFGEINPSEGDFVYADPPYDGAFSGYDAGGFTEESQERLRDAAVRWHESGASVMISNANTELIQRLYGKQPFILNYVSAPRVISCKPKGREAVEDLLITTYECRAKRKRD